MSRYLEEAAALLRDAAADFAKNKFLVESEKATKRLECAKAFAELAAIDKGLLPDRLAAKYVAEGGAR
ncbi:hypothetical protein AB0L13_20225 [Saccharopolyspora shandongensis]|uniref:hypothetical protein n=1 Tax=Saccharopolyspora shandongensis TaxID=418495 RepID=UPI00343DD821